MRGGKEREREREEKKVKVKTLHYPEIIIIAFALSATHYGFSAIIG